MGPQGWKFLNATDCPLACNFTCGFLTSVWKEMCEARARSLRAGFGWVPQASVWPNGARMVEWRPRRPAPAPSGARSRRSVAEEAPLPDKMGVEVRLSKKTARAALRRHGYLGYL